MEISKVLTKKETSLISVAHEKFSHCSSTKKISNFSKLPNFFIFENLRNFINKVEKDKAVNSTNAGPKSG
jgi:hypothetical protein